MPRPRRGRCVGADSAASPSTSVPHAPVAPGASISATVTLSCAAASSAKAASLSGPFEHARYKPWGQAIPGVRDLLDDRPDGDHLSARLRRQQHAGDTSYGNAASPRNPSAGRLVDEQEPGAELLGQGNRFGFTEVEKLPELQYRLLIGRRSDGSPTRGQSARERGRAGTAGPDREFSVNRRWNDDLPVQAPQKVESAGAGQGDERPGIGDDGCHEATPTSSSSSSGG